MNKLFSIIVMLLYPGLAIASVDMNVIAGFEGYYKYRHWLPLRVTLSSTDSDLENASINVDTGEDTTYSSDVTLFRSSRKTQYLYIFLDGLHRNVSVKLTDKDGRDILQKNVPIIGVSPKDKFILVVESQDDNIALPANISFDSPDYSADAIDQYDQSQNQENQSIHVSYSTVDLLPNNWKGYDSVDIIVLGNISIDKFSPSQQKAIISWLCSGGKLVISGGTGSYNLKGTFIEKLLPVNIYGSRVVKSSSLSRHFGYSINDTEIVIASSQLNDSGKSIMESDGMPVIAEREIGDGKCIFLAYNYLDPAFRSWEHNRFLLDKVLTQKDQSSIDYNAASKLFDNTALAGYQSYKHIGIFLIIYLVCLSCYILLRLLPSLGGTRGWIFLPAVIIIFALVASGINYSKGGKVLGEYSVVNIYQSLKIVGSNCFFSVDSRADTTMTSPEYLLANSIDANDLANIKNADIIFKEEAFQMNLPKATKVLYAEYYVDLNDHLGFFPPNRTLFCSAGSLSKKSGYYFNVSITDAKITDNHISGNLINNLPYDLSECFIFIKGRYARIGEFKIGEKLGFICDKIYTGNTLDYYSTEDSKRQEFIKIIKDSLLQNIPDKALIGWANESALEILAGISIGQGYKSRGEAFVIAHL